jgi:hypothetical protein
MHYEKVYRIIFHDVVGEHILKLQVRRGLIYPGLHVANLHHNASVHQCPSLAPGTVIYHISLSALTDGFNGAQISV